MASHIYSDGFDLFEEDDSLWPQLQQPPPPIFPAHAHLTPPATQQSTARASQLSSIPGLRTFNSTFSDQQVNFYNPALPDFGNTQPRYQPCLPPISPLPQAGLGRVEPPSLPPWPHSPSNISPASHLDTSLPGPSHNLSSLLDLPAYPTTGPLFNPTRTATPSWTFGNLAAPPPREPTSDDYLQALVNGNFSSPSIPPLSPPVPQHPISEPSLAPPIARPSFSGPNTAGSLWTALSGQGELDHTKREGDWETERESKPFEQSSTSSTTDRMPTTRKRSQASVSAEQDDSISKRRRTRASVSSVTGRPKISPKRLKREHPEVQPKDEDIFDSDIEQDNLDVVNLVDLDEDVVVEHKAKVDNTVKLGNFQCVICMDDVKDLTVTFCGHLFCGECLHSSLHIDATKKICPICRQKIDVRPPGSRAKTMRTYFPLELKLISKNRLGKRPAYS